MRPRLIVPLAAALLFGAGDAAAQSIPLGAESRVWFTGASNLHDFTCRAAQVRGGVVVLAANTGTGSLFAGQPPALTGRLLIPVEGVDCGIPAMTRDLHGTLRAEHAPAITFALERYVVAPGFRAPSVRLEGQLSIAGVERPVTLVGTLLRDTTGAVRVQGSRRLRVTDFGVRPPRRFLGLVRVHETVRVHFDVVLPAEP
jgi:polyisoprenoid-binding protein YceI